MNQTMKSLPMQERPYEKCLLHGPQYLTDAELLAVIIRSGSRENNSIELAHQILKSMGYSISHMINVSLEELMENKGIGKVKAVQIQCVGELSKRIAKAKAGHALCFENPKTIADYYMEQLRHEKREHFLIMMLDNKSNLLHEMVLSIGTINQSYASSREIFIEALKRQAVHIIVVHNHPSGDPTPSPEDLHTTRRIKEAGQMIGIELMDHIIIGDNRYVSFRAQGIL